MNFGKNASTIYGDDSPSAKAVKIKKPAARDIVDAANSAVPMNGAEHGVATTVAMTPVTKDPRSPDDLTLPPAAVSDAPISKTPNRLSPKRNRNIAMIATNGGFCIWNPQPAAVPAACSPNQITATTQNDTTTPAANTRPCILIFALSSPACSTKPRILIDNTGNTHGMRLRISPPKNAPSNTTSSPLPASTASSSSAPTSAATPTDPGNLSPTGIFTSTPVVSSNTRMPVSSAGTVSGAAGTVNIQNPSFFSKGCGATSSIWPSASA